MGALHRDSLPSSGSEPRLGAASRRRPAGSGRAPVPPAPELAGRTVWPPALRFWLSKCRAHRSGEMALHIPSARPCRELDAVGKQLARGTQAGARAEEHARRDRLAPGQHLTCQVLAAGIQPPGTLQGTLLPALLGPWLPVCPRGRCCGKGGCRALPTRCSVPLVWHAKEWLLF